MIISSIGTIIVVCYCKAFEGFTSLCFVIAIGEIISYSFGVGLVEYLLEASSGAGRKRDRRVEG